MVVIFTIIYHVFPFHVLNMNFVFEEKKIDVLQYIIFALLNYYFFYYGKKVMTYTMVKKTPFKFPTERYLNIVKCGYKDCKLDIKYLKKALMS